MARFPILEKSIILVDSPGRALLESTNMWEARSNLALYISLMLSLVSEKCKISGPDAHIESVDILLVRLIRPAVDGFKNRILQQTSELKM